MANTTDSSTNSRFSNIETWNLKGFIKYFCDNEILMPDHSFCWVLGAGASVTSGIMAAGSMAKIWLRELHERLCRTGQSVEEWVNQKNLDIIVRPHLGKQPITFDGAAEWYSEIFERRFRHHREEGNAWLEAQMRNSIPGMGYSILAQIMATKRHRTVITTNFNHLLSDAFAASTDSHPLVIGHESLADYASARISRPLICKIHRDLFIDPQNSHRELRRLHDRWGMALHSLFSRYTPIFLGYGGHDDTLMDLLEGLEPGYISGRMIWIVRNQREVSNRICELLLQHNGVLVISPGFDETMIILGNSLGIASQTVSINDQAARRAKKIQDQLLQLCDSHSATGSNIYDPDRQLLCNALERTTETEPAYKDWWGIYSIRANFSHSYDRKISIYKDSVVKYPNESNLLWRSAQVLGLKADNYKAALFFHKKAVELAPKESVGEYLSYADFCWRKIYDYPVAEEMFEKCMSIEPSSLVKCTYARFIAMRHNKIDEAEKILRETLTENRFDHDALIHLAWFISVYRGDLSNALVLYNHSILLNPRHVYSYKAAGDFYMVVANNLDMAIQTYERGLSVDHAHPDLLANYCDALFLKGEKNKALEQVAKVRSLIIEDILVLELDFYCFSHDVESSGVISLKACKKLISKGVRSIGWPLTKNVELARRENHREINLLEVLANVISLNAPVADLDQFVTWRETSLE